MARRKQTHFNMCPKTYTYGCMHYPKTGIIGNSDINVNLFLIL